MKEMKYQAQRKVEVLDTGFCFGLLYYIMSLGTHPTAYIRIPKGHKLYGKDDAEIYQKIDINVHGGITYISDSMTIENVGEVDGWIIGWDYCHYGDYMGIEELERLNDESLKGEALQEERERAKSMANIAQTIINNGELALKTVKHYDDYGKKEAIPEILQIGDGKNG